MAFFNWKFVPSCINIRESKESRSRNQDRSPGKGRVPKAHKGCVYFLRGVVNDGVDGIQIMIRRPQVKQSHLKIQMRQCRNSFVQLILEKIPSLHKLHKLLLLEQIIGPTMSLYRLKNIYSTSNAVIQRRQQNIPPSSILLHERQTQHLRKRPKRSLPHTPCVIHQSIIVLRTPRQMCGRHPPHTLQNGANNGALKIPGLREHMPAIAAIITHSLSVPCPNRDNHVLKRH
ncbi:hypothetical protein CR513_56662, partial [Mucuna pruriens]